MLICYADSGIVYGVKARIAAADQARDVGRQWNLFVSSKQRCRKLVRANDTSHRRYADV